MIFKGTPEAFARAKDYLEQAIALDPQYAEPHAELSMYFILLATSNLRPSHEVTPLARAAARKALDLSPSESRAHAALALAAIMFDYDWKAAEEHVQKARNAGALAPETRIRCALALLVPRGRFPEAIREIETALAQDPLNGLFRGMLALVCATAGQHERAVSEAHKALEIDEKYWFAHYALSLSHATNGSLQEAKSAAENAVRVSPWNGRCVSMLAGILARLGEHERAFEVLAPWKDNPGCMAQYHMLTGAIDAAAESFEAAVDQRDPNVTLHVASVLLEPLRESPRWPAIARKMNLV